jgi:predicted transcriptional regulator
MRKTSVYLSDEDRARLARLAKARSKSHAEVLREALIVLERSQRPDRKFAMAGAVEGDGTDISKIPEEELLRGFGDDSHR